MSGLAPASLALPKQLQALPAGTFVTLEKLEQGGSLRARRLSTGAVQFYWRYANEGRTHREPVFAASQHEVHHPCELVRGSGVGPRFVHACVQAPVEGAER